VDWTGLNMISFFVVAAAT